MSFEDLYWLPETNSFRGFVRDAKNTDKSLDDRVAALISAAGVRHDFLGLLTLDKTAQRFFLEISGQLAGLQKVKLALLGSATLDHLLPGIRVAALRRGLQVEIYQGPYGQYQQEVLDASSGLYDFEPDAVLFVLDHQHAVPNLPADASLETAEEAVKKQADMMRHLWSAVRVKLSAQPIQQTVLGVHSRLFGNLDGVLPGSAAALSEGLNRMIKVAAYNEEVLVFDLAAQAAKDGLRQWFDPGRWHHAKQEVLPQKALAYGEYLTRILSAVKGRAKKCLVLDLDNTLWGGVIGDDGIDGIALGQGSAAGEAFQAFQRYVKSLAERGIILAVCSKNDHDMAMEAFSKHPEMVLSPDMVPVFVANWQDKASNIRTIAKELNIGLDSLVFFDDNPAEREIVRQTLPMVSVPEVPTDPAYYVQCLEDAGYFEAVSYTSDDTHRTRQYAENKKRNALLADATDMDAFLQGLAMEMTVGTFDQINLPRIAQLVNKTNQFNLTTRRYTETQLQSLMARPDVIALWVRLADRFGDNGLISVVIALPDESDPTAMRIDTWLMSCRVLGRGVEKETLNVLTEMARAKNVESLIGEFIPTAKNKLVKDLYKDLGFESFDGNDETVQRWVVKVGDISKKHTYISTEIVGQVTS